MVKDLEEVIRNSKQKITVTNTGGKEDITDPYTIRVVPDLVSINSKEDSFIVAVVSGVLGVSAWLGVHAGYRIADSTRKSLLDGETLTFKSKGKVYRVKRGK